MGYFSDSFSQFNGGFSVLEEQSLCEQYNFTSTEPEQDQLDGGTEAKNKNRFIRFILKRVLLRLLNTCTKYVLF